MKADATFTMPMCTLQLFKSVTIIVFNPSIKVYWTKNNDSIPGFCPQMLKSEGLQRHLEICAFGKSPRNFFIYLMESIKEKIPLITKKFRR